LVSTKSENFELKQELFAVAFHREVVSDIPQPRSCDPDGTTNE
jgi:hypothetical protein